MSTTAGPSKPGKLGGYDFYREVLGSPKYVVAPMVDASELAWRRLSRRYGAQLVYTPMINAKHFYGNKKFQEQQFDMISGEEGHRDTDRPLIVQFSSHDPEQLLKSAMIVAPYCDAVDLNLGCPQDIAKRGHYGSFLMEEWDLIYRMINTLHENLPIPVTAKFRVYKDIEKTVEYAKMLESAGAQILTVHGRTREQRGQNTALASWEHIRAVKQAVKVPVFANGNILFQEDIKACLEATGCDGVMTAEGNLYNVAILNGIVDPPVQPPLPSHLPKLKTPSLMSDPQHPPSPLVALEYLEIVRQLQTETNLSAIKGHMFKILRLVLGRHIDLRTKMGKIGKSPLSWKDGGLDPYVEVVEELWGRMCESEDGEEEKNATTGLSYWLTQPYFRPPPSWQTAGKRVRAEERDLGDLSGQQECRSIVPDTNVAVDGTTKADAVMG